MNADITWDFPTPAFLWDARSRSIVVGGDRLDAMSEDDFEASRLDLAARVHTMVQNLDDGWLVWTSFVMVDDIYKSFFQEFGWSRGIHAYLQATAGTVIEELQRRGFVLHYVVDATEGGANLQTMVDYLPEVFMAAGLAVVGPQLTARQPMRQIEAEPSEDLTAIKPYLAEGHMIADQVVALWHQDRRSSAYLNLDFNDDSPALSLDVALSPGGQRATIVVWRQEMPALDSKACFTPPPEVRLPPEIAELLG
jgi:hypothetical protein